MTTAFLLALALSAAGRPSGPAIRLSELRVECGRIDETAPGYLALRSPCIRALVGEAPLPGLEVAFTYLGPGRETAPLASGELRRQIGLKLRARDTCNVVYVMWHIAPTTGIHVSVKSNPGASLHRECGDHGYLTVLPADRRTVPVIRSGERHRLGASIKGDLLHVTADGLPVWEGRLPAAALAFDGPVGIRSDNGDFDVEVLPAKPEPGCGPRRRE